MDDQDNRTDRQWHLDKRVPIALILTLGLQTTGAIWWAASINARVGQNATAIQTLNDRSERQRGVAQSQAVQLGRIEEQITGLRTDIGRLIDIIERGRE